MNLDNFSQIYQSFIHFSGVQYSLVLAKSVAILLVLIYYFQTFFKAYGTKESSGFTYYQLFRPIILCLLIAGYTNFTDKIDAVASSAESYVITNLKNETTVVKSLDVKTKDETTPPKEDKQGTMDLIASSMSTVVDVLNYPSTLLVKIVNFLTELIDSFVYGFVCCARFAFLFILRFIGPLAIAASIHERFQQVFWTWLKAYGIIYLWIFVIFLINLFCALFARGIYNMKSVAGTPGSITESITNSGIIDGNYNINYAITLWFMVMVKLYLYLKSKKIIDQIFVSK